MKTFLSFWCKANWGLFLLLAMTREQGKFFVSSIDVFLLDKKTERYGN